MGSTSRAAGHPTRLQARLAAAAIITVGSGLGIGMAGIAPAAADPGNGNGNAYGLTQGNSTGNGNGNAAQPGPAPAASASSGQGASAPGSSADHGQGHGQGNGQGHGQGHSQGHSQGHGQGNGSGAGHDGGGRGDGPGKGRGHGAPAPTSTHDQAGAHHGADPAGNNGTVKIAPLGELDGIPNNTPHPGCTFQVEWYGYDEGADIVSTVSFAEQAPTTDVGLSVSGPTQVFVGGDPATGAGTPTGLDGTQAYTLSFAGAPHPQQGYHVKLTVSTPRSLGNDTKTKVFWVEDCRPAASTPTTAPETPAPSDTSTTHHGHGQSDQEHGNQQQANQGHGHQGHGAGHVHPASDVEVLGEQAFAAPTVVAPVVRASAPAALPTAVNAGVAGSAAPVSAETSVLGLLLVLMGGLAGRLAWTRRARG
jgi:hypothetical protein